MSARQTLAALAAFLISLSVLGGGAWAQTFPPFDPLPFAPPDQRWRAITETDLGAAYKLLRDNDPGGAPELHDTAFMDRLEKSHKLALARVPKVTSYDGYVAVLAGFANGMGDKHIWSRPSYVTNRPFWPGFLMSKRGDAWIVADVDPLQASLKGARLISCDGTAAEDYARKTLGAFRAEWSIGAQQIQNAPWLLIDDGNPFISRPKTCLFDQAGKSQSIDLDWQLIKREQLLPRVHAAIGAGAAGFGVRKSGDGYWIALESLGGDHPPEVVKAVEAQKDELRKAKWVVLDLRGNGGGASLFADEIAVSLFGKAAVSGRMGPDAADDPNPCGGLDGVWRVTPDNIANMKQVGAYFGARNAPEVKKFAEQVVSLLEAAQAKGKDLAGDLNCKAGAPPPPAPRQIPSLMSGRMIVLTDNLCFSSCLSTVQEFLALGAYQVGQTTDAATRFVDLREQHLPSGYSTFTVLQSVHLEILYQMGPFTPSLFYNGDISDTAALEKWVAGTVVAKAAPTGAP
jgi:hypothetical protein